MLKWIDKAISRLLRRLFRPRFFVARAERQMILGKVRSIKWCVAPADASDKDLLRIFALIDEPESENVTVWFCSSLKDIGKRPFDIALLERDGEAQPTITRSAGHRKEVRKV